MNNTLPKLNSIMEKPDYVDTIEYKYNTTDREKLVNLIKDLIGADCWAVTFDDEILFNEYVNKSIREKIEDQNIRDSITDNVHRNLLVHSVRKYANSKIVIYMFGQNSWTVTIDYIADDCKFLLSFHKY